MNRFTLENKTGKLLKQKEIFINVTVHNIIQPNIGLVFIFKNQIL